MGDEEPDTAGVFRPRPATRDEIALVLGRARPDPLWVTALLSATGMVLAGFLLYAFSVAASAMEFKHSKGARPMRRLCQAATWLLVGIPPLCVAASLLGRLSARRKLRTLEGDSSEDFVEAARIQPLDTLQLDYPGRQEPDLVFRIGGNRVLVLRGWGTCPGDKALPNADFEVVRLRSTRRRLCVAAHGAHIETVWRRDGTSWDLTCPDGEPFEADWDSLVSGVS